jgi:hypothetical protein
MKAKDCTNFSKVDSAQGKPRHTQKRSNKKEQDDQMKLRIKLPTKHDEKNLRVCTKQTKMKTEQETG